MKNLFAKYALTAVIPMLFAQCQDMELNHPESEKVDLILSAPLSETKTMLQDNSTVLWTEGDKVTINGNTYPVEIDPQNPASALVKGVYKTSEYVAVYPEGNTLSRGEIVFAVPELQEYRKGGFAPKVNPMIAVGKGTNLSFRNIGSIVRFGLTGSGEKITGLVMMSNNEEEDLSGEFYIYKSDFENGNLGNIQNDYSENDNSVTIDFPEHLELSSEPQYVYVVVPPVTLSSGFSLLVADDKSGISEIVTNNAITFESSRIKQMEDVNCSFSDAISFTALETTFSEVSMSIQKKAGMHIKYAIFEKDSYEEYCKQYENKFACNRNLVMEFGDRHWEEEAASLNITIDRARSLSNSTANKVALSSGKEYIILASYLLDNRLDDNQEFGGIASYVFKTAEPTGNVPTLSITPLTAEYPWCNAAFSATTDGYEIYATLMPKAEYESMSATMSDSNIAKSSGDVYWNGESFSYGQLFPETEYLLMAVAVSEGGMETIQKVDYTTPSYEECVLETDTEWATVSENASFQFGFLMKDDTEESVVAHRLKVEKDGTGKIFRIESPLSVSKNPELEAFGFRDTQQSYYIYIEVYEDNSACIQIRANELGIEHIGYPTLYLGSEYTWDAPYYREGSYSPDEAVIRFDDLTIKSRNGNSLAEYGIGAWGVNQSVLYLNGKGNDSLGHEGFGTSGDPMEW